MGMKVDSRQPVGYASLSARIIRKDGTVEDKGIIAEYRPEKINLLRRAARAIKDWFRW